MLKVPDFLRERYCSAASAATVPSPTGGAHLSERLYAHVPGREYSLDTGLHPVVRDEIAVLIVSQMFRQEPGVRPEADKDEDP